LVGQPSVPGKGGNQVLPFLLTVDSHSFYLEQIVFLLPNHLWTIENTACHGTLARGIMIEFPEPDTPWLGRDEDREKRYGIKLG